MPTNDDPIDLLTSPIFTVATDDARIELSLAGLLARMGRGETTELACLMPHQRHVMHAFLVQLAALVCARTGDSRIERDEGEWRSALRQLAACTEAFQLIVSDLSKPAFMQPPVPEVAVEGWSRIERPDALDILVTSKNHDIKSHRIRTPRNEHWVYALISLQTQSGYPGKKNYGIARMNAGTGNRPGLGIAASLDLSARFRRDIAVLSASRPALLSTEWPYREDGLALLWLEPWNGLSSLRIDLLDPFFIEICRRVRFQRREGEFVACIRPTEVARVEAKELKGNTGDVWTPVEIERGVALTLGPGGFEYGKVSDLLFGDNWRRPAALEVRAEDGSMPLAIMRALVRGKSKTRGYHERVILVPERARALFASPEGRSQLGTLARARVESARALRRQVLHPALCALLQGGSKKLEPDDRDRHILDDVDRTIDVEFFGKLFNDAQLPAEEQRARFDGWLYKLGKRALKRGIDCLPVPAARRERAIAAAEGCFRAAARKQLPAAFQEQPPETESV